jgi:hypothetical protein
MGANLGKISCYVLLRENLKIVSKKVFKSSTKWGCVLSLWARTCRVRFRISDRRVL